jgi:hypothetical protein
MGANFLQQKPISDLGVTDKNKTGLIDWFSMVDRRAQWANSGGLLSKSSIKNRQWVGWLGAKNGSGNLSLDLCASGFIPKLTDWERTHADE